MRVWTGAQVLCVGGALAAMVGCSGPNPSYSLPGDKQASGGDWIVINGAGGQSLEGARGGQGQQSGCTYTQGWWKNHANQWDGSVTLGNRSYSESELLQIWGQPVQGNGLVALAHQLAAAKLNI